MSTEQGFVAFPGGGKRDDKSGKPRMDLLRPLRLPYAEQMLTRAGAWMEQGARRYGERNWESFRDEDALSYARASVCRHFEQWLAGETDEDHAAAVWINVMMVEYIRYRLRQPSTPVGFAPTLSVVTDVEPVYMPFAEEERR